MKSFMICCKANELKKNFTHKLDELIEESRTKMTDSIDKNGRQANITVSLSQELDKLIVAKMRC